MLLGKHMSYRGHLWGVSLTLLGLLLSPSVVDARKARRSTAPTASQNTAVTPHATDDPMPESFLGKDRWVEGSNALAALQREGTNDFMKKLSDKKLIGLQKRTVLKSCTSSLKSRLGYARNEAIKRGLDPQQEIARSAVGTLYWFDKLSDTVSAEMPTYKAGFEEAKDNLNKCMTAVFSLPEFESAKTALERALSDPRFLPHDPVVQSDGAPSDASTRSSGTDAQATAIVPSSQLSSSQASSSQKPRENTQKTSRTQSATQSRGRGATTQVRNKSSSSNTRANTRANTRSSARPQSRTNTRANTRAKKR